jgi:hypothetical protein
MPANKSPERKIIYVSGLSNVEFLSRYAAPGRIGLAGGTTLVDKAIRRAERHIDEAQRWSTWSHAFFFGELRSDGHHWVMESDLQFIHKHIQLGVQENRASKYHDEACYDALAVIDLELSEEKTVELLRHGLELVANRTRYSVGELFGTLLALRNPVLRGRKNLLSREHSIYCSAFVQQVFRKAGLDLVPGVDVKNTAPEDLARSPLIRTLYVLERPAEPTVLAKAAQRIQNVKAKLQEARSKLVGKRNG